MRRRTFLAGGTAILAASGCARGREPGEGLFAQGVDPILEIREPGRVGDHALEGMLRRRLGAGP